MNPDTGRFETKPEIVAALRERHGKQYGPSAPLPTLFVGEEVHLNSLPLVVTKIKPSGRLQLKFSTPMRIGFDPGDVVVIKGVDFKVTYWAGELLGLRMVKKGPAA